MGRTKKYQKIRDPNLHIVMKVEMSRETSFYGPGVNQLLEGIEKFHSITLAAQQMDMSYNKALRIIKKAEEGLGYQLVERQIGGAHGGGSRLTDRARELHQQFIIYESLCRRYVEEQFLKCFPGL